MAIIHQYDRQTKLYDIILKKKNKNKNLLRSLNMFLKNKNILELKTK